MKPTDHFSLRLFLQKLIWNLWPIPILYPSCNSCLHGPPGWSHLLDGHQPSLECSLMLWALSFKQLLLGLVPDVGEEVIESDHTHTSGSISSSRVMVGSPWSAEPSNALIARCWRWPSLKGSENIPPWGDVQLSHFANVNRTPKQQGSLSLSGQVGMVKMPHEESPGFRQGGKAKCS